jgi:hypothetical protein
MQYRRDFIWIPALIFLVGSAAAFANDPIPAEALERKARIEQRTLAPTREALQRRSRSIALIKQQGIPVMEGLPVIETTREARRRSKQEIADRAVALVLVAYRGEQDNAAYARSVAGWHQAIDKMTPKERAFFTDDYPEAITRSAFTWRYEAACVMFWALGFVKELPPPSKECDAVQLLMRVIGSDHQRFLKGSKLRPLASILDAADLAYRYHWALRDAQQRGASLPNVRHDIIIERHAALNWLIGYMDQDWDDITTDT